MRQYPDFGGNGYATELIEAIFKGKSERTYIASYDISVLRSQSFDSYSPIQGDFFIQGNKLYLKLSKGYNGFSIPFTTELISENRPTGNLRFEGTISGPKLFGADVSNLTTTFIKNFLILTEDGKLVVVDFA